MVFHATDDIPAQTFWNSRWTMPAVTLVILLSLFVLNQVIGPPVGDRISANDGLGWDGKMYARIAKEFYGVVFQQGLNGYHLGRILPSAVVYHGLALLRLPTT